MRRSSPWIHYARFDCVLDLRMDHRQGRLVGGLEMIKRICRWILRHEITDTEIKWWKAGVNQQLHEPESAEHGHISKSMYWYGEEE